LASNILLNVLDIYLDTENPRHEPIYDQPKIIEHLLQGERVKNLARHIATHGINPLDSIGVIKDEEDNYVVVEGNRRTCALLLLNDPNKAPSNEIEYFKKLTEENRSIPNSINCVLFESPDEAYTWMGVRHSGEQEGIGVKNWDAKQKTRHNGRINKPDQNALALSLIEYAVEKTLLHSEKTDRIITTAARYLGNPFVRETFGIVSSRSEQDVKICVPCNEFERILERFCDDLIANTVVHSRTRREDWIGYAKSLIKEGVAPVTKTEVHLLSDCLQRGTEPNVKTKKTINQSDENPKEGYKSFDNSGDSKNEKGSAKTTESDKQHPKAGTNKNPDSRKYIIPPDFRVSINNKILRRVYGELRNILITENTLSIALLTRAFLENLFILFHEEVTGSYQKMQTHVLMQKVINEIGQDSTLTKREKDALAALRRVQSNELNVLSPKTLGANAHAGIYPNAKELVREFDNISEIVLYMLRRV